MKKLLFCIIITNFISESYSQIVNLDSIFEPKLCGEIFQMKRGTVGKQFYCDNWLISNIKLNSGEWVTNKQLKYNGFIDEVIWLPSGNYRFVKLEKHFIDEFCFTNYNGSPVRFKKIKYKATLWIDSADIFAEVLCEKNLSLYAYRNVKVEGTKDRLIDGVNYTFDKLVPNLVYILKFPNQKSITFTKISRRILLKVLPKEYINSVKDAIQVNHISLRTEKDLIRLVTLIN